MTGNIRGISAKYVYMEDNVVDGREVFRDMMDHPVLKTLYEVQVSIMAGMSEKEAAKINQQLISVMLYVDTLENNISKMKDDVIDILKQYPDKARHSRGLQPGEVISNIVVTMIAEEVNNL